MYYTCSGPVLGGQLGQHTHQLFSKHTPCSLPGHGLQGSSSWGVGGEEPCMGAGPQSSSPTSLPDCNCSASQRSQTSAVHRHDPTQRREALENIRKTLFRRKIPFRHLLFLILIAEFHLEKFLTAHAVSSARAAFLRPAPQGVSEMFFYLK